MVRRHGRKRRWLGLLVLALGLGGLASAWSGASIATTEAPEQSALRCSPARAPEARVAGAGGAGEVVLLAYDADQQPLGWSGFRARQRNGNGENGDNDVLVDPVSLEVVSMWPLRSSDGADGAAFDWPGRPVTLALAWPSSLGYGNLLLDVDAPGTYLFNTLAANQHAAALDAALGARPTHRPSAALTAACGRSRELLDQAAVAGSEAARDALAAAALDAVAEAWAELLIGHGPQHASAQRATQPQQWGVTFDSIDQVEAAAATVAALVSGGEGDGWVRLVFDRELPAASYRPAVDAIHAAGLRVTGQILDSYQMAEVGVGAFEARVREYVDGLPGVDQWEVGNEINGEWLGNDVVAKLRFAARYAKERGKPTLLTLYWQLGESDAEHSLFTWAAANLDAALLGDLDVLGLSVYPEEHPMGAATLDRVLRTLHAAYPTKRLAITELGYGSEDLVHQWWYGSPDDPTGAGRLSVARLYQSAILGYPFSAGGAYWWYYLQEALPPSPLWDELRGIRVRSL